MTLISRQDQECNRDRHSHNDEGPCDPCGIMLSEKLCLWPQVNRDRDRNGENGDEGNGQRKPERLRPPVEAIEVEHLGDPDKGRDIVEAVVDEEEEPEVELDLCRAVTWCLRAIAVWEIWPVIVRQRVCRKRYCAPGDGLSNTISIWKSKVPIVQELTSAAGRKTRSPYLDHHLSTILFTAACLGSTQRSITHLLHLPLHLDTRPRSSSESKLLTSSSSSESSTPAANNAAAP